MQLKPDNSSAHLSFNRSKLYLSKAIIDESEAKGGWQRANLIIIIRMFPVKMETCGGE